MPRTDDVSQGYGGYDGGGISGGRDGGGRAGGVGGRNVGGGFARGDFGTNFGAEQRGREQRQQLAKYGKMVTGLLPGSFGNFFGDEWDRYSKMRTYQEVRDAYPGTYGSIEPRDSARDSRYEGGLAGGMLGSFGQQQSGMLGSIYQGNPFLNQGGPPGGPPPMMPQGNPRSIQELYSMYGAQQPTGGAPWRAF